MSSKYNNNKKHGNVFKNWLCPSFVLLPKKSELPKLWGGLQPPSPPRPVRLWLRCFLHVRRFEGRDNYKNLNELVRRFHGF